MRGSKKKKVNVSDVEIRKKNVTLPSTDELKQELGQEKYRWRYRQTMKSTIQIIIVVCAISILIATILCPIFKIYGTAMEPTLEKDQIVLSISARSADTGDIVGVYYGNKILIKRCIATGGQTVDIRKDGTVLVDEKELVEPYATGKSVGECNIELPYKVPDKHIFVMGDQRDVSLDSRIGTVGCISNDDIVGKVVFRIWPLRDFGRVK